MTERLTIALAGNPNSGKTSLFNTLTGAHQHVGNYPGVTVEKKEGRARLDDRVFDVVDLPGTYSLTHYSLEERVARDFLLDERPDVVINIVDATNLDRHLYLTVQLLELGVPVVVALNMVDLAEKRGIEVDHQKLSELLRLPVVPTVARVGRGREEVLRAAAGAAVEGDGWRPRDITYGHDVDEVIAGVMARLEKSGPAVDSIPPRWLAVKRLEGDPLAERTLAADPDLAAEVDRLVRGLAVHIRRTTGDTVEAIIADHRYGFISGLTRQVTTRLSSDGLTGTDRLDRVLTHRLLGPLLMGGVIYVLFWFVFTLGEYPVAWMGWLFSVLKDGVEAVLAEGFLRSLITSGIIDGVGGVISFAPLILLMFFGIAVIEDTGYMARMAYMLDRVLRVFGLHGTSTLALIVSGGITGGCAVPGVMATRTLRAPKERLATILVAPFMTCGAKLPVFALLVGAFFPGRQAIMMMIVVVLSWVFALSAAWVLRQTVLRGESSPFVMELPPYRMPTLRGLLVHTWERTWLYVKKAGTWILAVAVILWALMSFPQMSAQQTKDLRTRLESEAAAKLLRVAEFKVFINDRQALAAFDRAWERYRIAVRSGAPWDLAAAARDLGPALPLARGMTAAQPPPGLARAARAYGRYRRALAEVDNEVAAAGLRYSIAGRIGVALEVVTRPLGFNWQTNIALVGGFAAKEVIVSTLGTAYSLGRIEADDAAPLAQRLRQDRRWNPLAAMSLIVFIILYVPCFVTVLTIRHEAGTRWALFAMAYSLVAAYTVALVVYQGGRLLGWGLN